MLELHNYNQGPFLVAPLYSLSNETVSFSWLLGI